jgi:predicted anti-sigma-YlaC factor YlaD
MNCTIIRDKLPAFVYADVAPAEREQVEKHLHECFACRQEQIALQRVQQLLGSQAPFAANVDVSRIYRESAERATRKGRRWRRTAWTMSAVAAGVALAVFSGAFEARWDREQFVLRFGRPVLNVAPAAPALAADNSSGLAVDESLQDVNKQLQVLSKLVQAVVDDVQEQDRQHQQSIALLLARLEALRKQTNNRYFALEREVDTLSRLSQKGE